MGLIKNFFKNFIKLSRPNFSFEDNELKFKINSDHFYTYALDNVDIKTRHDSYILEAYTLKTDDLFIEYVKVDNDVSWNGLPSSFFISLLKEKLHIKNMEQLEKKEYDGYDFITYRIDEHFILNFIYIYELNKDVFIIDIKSELYENLLKSFDGKYTYKYEKNSDEKMAIDISVVKENAFNGYFRLDS